MFVVPLFTPLTLQPNPTVTPTGTAAGDYVQPYLDAHRMR